jgi:hypothetical protein
MQTKFISTILIFITLTSFSPIKLKHDTKNKCRTVDDVVKQTIKALQKRDVSLYLELWSKEKFLEWLKENPGIKHSSELIEKADKFKELHEKDFNSLLKQIEAQSGHKKSEITYISHKINFTQTENGATDNYVDIIFVVNGKSKRISTPMTEFKGCVYYFEPIADIINEQ